MTKGDVGMFDELIARLEAATGPSRDLDAGIAALCHPTDDQQYAAFENGRDYPDVYTSSLDAALTLVPEGWGLYSLGQCDEWWESEIGDASRAASEWWYGHSKTAAIAICIACLRARASAPQTVE